MRPYTTEELYSDFNKHFKKHDIKYKIEIEDNITHVIYKKPHNKITIADCFIEITEIYKLKNNYVICYELEPDTHYPELKDEYINGDIIYNPDSETFDLKDINNTIKIIDIINFKLIQHEELFIKAVKEFAKFSLGKFIDLDMISRCKVGWDYYNNKIIFRGVTDKVEGKANLGDIKIFEIKNLKFENLIKNNILYKIEEPYYPIEDERTELIQEAAENVLSILKKHPDLCVLFSYDILALTYCFFDESNNIKRFPICVCGRNKNTTENIVANIFCNMQYFDPNRPNTIFKKTNIQYTSIFTKLNNFLCYSDITMLIPLKNGLFKSMDHTLIKIIKDTIDNNISYFPVFITKNEPNILEVINVNVSSFDDFPSAVETEKILDLKISINRLLLEYIIFLSDFDNGILSNLSHINTSIKLKTERQLNKFKKLKNIDGNIEDQYLLYIRAMIYFRQFLNYRNCENVAKEIYDICFDVFKKRATDFENAPISENMLIEIFKKYIESIFIDKTLCPNYFYTEGTEKRGKRENCYYLEYKYFYSDFCSKNGGIIIDEKAFLHVLKTAALIKTKDDISYGVERKFKELNKKIYVLAVIKEKINCN